MLPLVTSARRGKQMLPLAKMRGKKTVGTQQAECIAAVMQEQLTQGMELGGSLLNSSLQTPNTKI